MGGPMGNWQTAAVDGTVIANITIGGKDLQIGDACAAEDFPHDLTGKQAMGLQAGPESATTADACREACCSMGADCAIYQFSKTPSIAPDCWLGKSTSFKDDTSGNYISRGRASPAKPWHIKVE